MFTHTAGFVAHQCPALVILEHGRQVGRFFHGYYDHYCFLPLYVFCGAHLLVSYLRPSNIDGAKHAWAILALLVKRLRRAWPEVRLILRADSGFCRHRMLSWCERKGLGYIIGGLIIGGIVGALVGSNQEVKPTTTAQ